MVVNIIVSSSVFVLLEEPQFAQYYSLLRVCVCVYTLHTLFLHFVPDLTFAKLC